MSSNEPTVQQCFDVLRGSLNEVIRLICTAPLPQNERAGLSLMVAGLVFGTTARLMNKDAALGAREVADLIVDTMRTTIPAPSLVPQPPADR